MRKAFLIVFTAVVVTFAFNGSSFAHSIGISGFDALNLKLPSDGSGTISIVGSRGLKQWQPHFGLTAAFNRHMVSTLRNNQKIWPVSYAFTGDFVAALGFFDFLSAGIEVPVAALENIRNVNSNTSYNEVNIGDIRFDVKGRVLEDKGWHPGVAIIPSIFAPTGDVNNFTGNTGVRYQGLLVVDKDFGPVYVTLNGGYRFVEKKVVVNTTIDDQLIYGLGVAVKLPVWNRSLQIIAEGNGASVVRNFSKSTTSIEAIGGLRKTFTNGLRVDIAGSGGIVKALGTPDFRVMAGLGYTMPQRKKAAKMPVISETIYFPHGDKIEPDYYGALINIGRTLIEYQQMHALIEGYTDSYGKASYNQMLSEKRAEEVKKYLLQYFGARENQLTAVGRGTENPAAPNDTVEGRARNRRATINSR